MFICTDCEYLFEDPKYYVEKHGLDTPPYEEFYGCPHCAGAFVETFKCDLCGDWIIGNYVKIDNDRYCEDCYTKYELGEED